MVLQFAPPFFCGLQLARLGQTGRRRIPLKLSPSSPAPHLDLEACILFAPLPRVPRNIKMASILPFFPEYIFYNPVHYTIILTHFPGPNFGNYPFLFLVPSFFRWTESTGLPCAGFLPPPRFLRAYPCAEGSWSFSPVPRYPQLVAHFCGIDKSLFFCQQTERLKFVPHAFFFIRTPSQGALRRFYRGAPSVFLPTSFLFLS